MPVGTGGDAGSLTDTLGPLRAVAGADAARAWDLDAAMWFDAAAAWGPGRPRWPLGAAAAEAPAAGPLERDVAAAAPGDVGGARAIADAYWRRIAAHGPALAAFITVCPPDHPQARPGPGPLCGAAIACKDIVETAGLRTTGGSRVRGDHVPARDAACWARLRAAGALCLGKTNTHEFAAGTTGENDWYGTVRNPRDPGRVAGGSSSGSAAAVAAGLCSAALGTDTGGSVRIPAACCGVVGFKPTFGRISRAGVFPLSWSLDHVGVLAATVRDAAMLFGVMAGPDPADPATRGLPPYSPRAAAALGLAPASGLAGVRVGVPWAWLDEQGDEGAASGGLPTAAAIRRAFARALGVLAELGAAVREVDLGSAEHAVSVNRLLALPESAAYHAADLDGRPEAFGDHVRPRLLAGRLLSAEHYVQGQRLRRLLCRRYAEAMRRRPALHLVATPTLPIAAPRIPASPQEARALLRFCAPWNVAGWPAISIPCGPGQDGLPAGLQLAAPPGADRELLAAAAAVGLTAARPLDPGGDRRTPAQRR